MRSLLDELLLDPKSFSLAAAVRVLCKYDIKIVSCVDNDVDLSEVIAVHINDDRTAIITTNVYALVRFSCPLPYFFIEALRAHKAFKDLLDIFNERMTLLALRDTYSDLYNVYRNIHLSLLLRNPITYQRGLSVVRLVTDDPDAKIRYFSGQKVAIGHSGSVGLMPILGRLQPAPHHMITVVCNVHALVVRNLEEELSKLFMIKVKIAISYPKNKLGSMKTGETFLFNV